MGSCQSSVVAATIVSTQPGRTSSNKPSDDAKNITSSKKQAVRCRVDSITGSNTNTCSSMTSCHQSIEDLPIPEERSLDIGFIPSEVIATPPKSSRQHQNKTEDNDNASSSSTSHTRRHSDMIADYLKSEGASSSRIMVHIENPCGMPIEAVYDGVHDGEVLGEGITGAVRRITHKKTGIERGEYVYFTCIYYHLEQMAHSFSAKYPDTALKRLDLSLVADDDHLDRLLDEIKIMCALDHPNIVCLEEVYEGDSELYLTQELCKGGDLFDRLDEQPDYHYSEAECARLVKQISSAVAYLHAKGVIHRDLKLENFLFQDEGKDSELKMIDFGLSKHFQEGDTQTEKVGTPYTVAPEVILGKGYDERCDVWSLGVICYLLLCGETPFGGACEGDDLGQVRQNIISGNIPFHPALWGRISEEAIDFIKSLLVLDPTKRPTALEAQHHPWIQSLWKKSHDSCDNGALSQNVVNGLVDFKSLSTTKRFLCEVLSFTLQPEQIQGLHEEFEKMDVDGKGEITLSKFKGALLAQSGEHLLRDEEIEDIFSGLKVRNTDTSIQWHEFIAACLSQCRIDDRNIRLAFERLDRDRKGFITWKDLQASMEMYGSTSSNNDLQQLWVNHIIDYKVNKEHMTYERQQL